MIKVWINKLSGTGNIYSLLSNIVFSAFGFASFLILVRSLNKEVFGMWVLFITVATLLDMFRLGLTGTAAIRIISSKISEKNNSDEESETVAASYHLGMISTFIIALLFIPVYFYIQNINSQNVYLPILLYYPLLSIANLPFHQALVWAQGKVDFRRVFILRLIAGAVSFCLVVGYVVFFNGNIIGVIQAYIISYAITGIIAVVFNWDGRQFIRLNSKLKRKEILQFGKYSTASYIGSNLLRSSDTLLLSTVPFMGTEAIAIFAVPFKFVEVVEIPLRSFTATAFPRLTKSLTNGIKEFNKMLFSYTFWTTVLLIPVAIILALFPSFFLGLVGGANYESSLTVQRNILYLICIYILILPLDRYSGVALFATNKPQLNFYKIMFMLIANVIFDLIAILLFKSLVYVAMATLIFTILGIVVGWFYVLRDQKHNLKAVLKRGFGSKTKSLQQIIRWNFQ